LSTAARLDELRMEAQYRRERLAVYKQRVYAGRTRRDEAKLRELQRGVDGALARLRRAGDTNGA